MWYLIVSIPDLCTLAYFYLDRLSLNEGQKYCFIKLSFVNIEIFVLSIFEQPLKTGFIVCLSVSSKDIRSKLEKQIEYVPCKGKIILCGDLISRVGYCLDLVA